MTEKEKAKAYDEAIEIAKKWYNELKESEDEKIKNAILNHLKKMWGNCQDDVCGVHVEDAIDWLEKQDKKSNWKPSKEEMDVLYSLSYITNEYDEYKEYVITHLYQDLKREFFNDSSYENMFSLDNKEDDVRRRSTIQVLEYARSLDAYNQYGKADIDKNIAWLEKQGKEEYGLKSFKDEDVRKFMQYIEKQAKAYEFNLPNRSYDIYAFAKDLLVWLEKQSEQESSQTNERAWLYLVSEVLTWKDGIGQYLDDPRVQELSKRLCSEYAQKLYNPSNTEKNEPKFKVGDWIITPKNKVLQITSIEGISYRFNNESHYWPICNCDEECRLWTIEDAKDGDVLYSFDSNQPFIYKERNNYEQATAYCGLNMYGKFFVWGTKDCAITLNNYVPATKKQLDALMKAMNDAGYKWNVETKTLEKLAEHKFKVGDKIEPRFKVGDWVVNKFGDSWYIDSLDKKNYQVSDGKGNYNYFPISKQDEMHLWTVQDAKDGDVLANDHHILILKELVYDWSSNGTPFITLPKLHSVKAYCGIKSNGNFEIGKDNWCFCGTLHILPATKEQRDLLFQKIKEADYEWDADKKELKKLVKPKFKVGDMVRHKKTNRDDVYEISKVYCDSYGIDGFPWLIFMEYQDQYELVTNKFDPKALKPLDSVLAKNDSSDYNL